MDSPFSLLQVLGARDLYRWVCRRGVACKQCAEVPQAWPYYNSMSQTEQCNDAIKEESSQQRWSAEDKPSSGGHYLDL
jgi:hypothetical protein